MSTDLHDELKRRYVMHTDLGAKKVDDDEPKKTEVKSRYMEWDRSTQNPNLKKITPVNSKSILPKTQPNQDNVLEGGDQAI